MNLKYYLRGLGLGIVITAIIMGIATGGKKESLTNEEIVARAKELGMVEDRVLTDYAEKAKSMSTEEEQQPAETEPKVDMVLPELEIVSSEDDKPEQELPEAEMEIQEGMPKEDSPAEKEIEVQKKAEEDKKVFQVKKGEAPYKICERLEVEGFVTSAEEFDTFLLNNGYDRKIVAAEYLIPANADELTIARIITGEKVEAE